MHRFYRQVGYDVVEEPISDTLELPTLGCLMRVGTLYDCRGYEVVTSYHDNPPDQLKLLEQKGTKINIIQSDSFSDKSEALGLDASLRASVLVDLVRVDAGAKYIRDRQPPDSQCRMTLHIQKTTKLEFVTLETLKANLKGKTPDVFTQGRATHVVSSALYGSNTFIVLDYCGGEDKENAAKVLHDLVNKIEVFAKGGEGTPAVDEYPYVKCTIYSDLTQMCDRTNIKGLFTFMTALPELSEEKNAVIKVFLYPLSKIDPRSARIFSSVSDGVTAQVLAFLEGLEDCLISSHELASDPICTDFPQMKEKLDLFKRLLTEYRSAYKKEIRRLLPRILGGSDGEGCIREMFREVNSSPFNLTSMTAWAKSKRKEVNAIKKYITFLPNVEIVNSLEALDGILLDPSIDIVVCFTFRLKGSDEGYLRVLSDYIAPARQISSYKDVQWYDDMALLRKMRLKAKLFSEFFESNNEKGCTKFIVTGFQHDQSGSSEGDSGRIGGAKVNLFEEGELTQEDFQPPSRPLHPQCTINDQHSATLMWTSPEHGISNVQSYTVKCEVFRGRREQLEHREIRTKDLETSVALDNLKPNQSIQFQVIAVCSAGASAESERSFVATTPSAQSPEKPEFHNVTDSSVTLKWRQPGKMAKDEVMASYVIELMEADGITKIDTKSSETEFKIKQLEPNTSYTFQVVSVYESGIESPPSATSDLCTTLPANQPGKPTVNDTKSSSAVITWTDPTNVGRGVELFDYFIEYCKAANHQQSTRSAEGPWEKVVLPDNGITQKCRSVSGLDPNMTYMARVTLVCLVDNGKKPVMIPSIISDYFTTLPAGPPRDLKAQQISASQIKLTWKKPAAVGIDTELMHYEIHYRPEKGSGRATTETGDSSCEFIISSVQPGTHYNIEVLGFYGSAGKGEGDTVRITTRILLKNNVIGNAKILNPCSEKDGKPQILSLPLRTVCEKAQSRSCIFGGNPKIGREHKVIMVVGVTGSGKSTLINAMVNHILEVEWYDEYRFKVVNVGEENGASQAHSQTQTLTSYTLNDENLHLPFTLTIIDTPGFGDTRGIQRDKEIFEQIREFFLDSESHGIDHIDAIGFVVQASQARLTPTQKYVFDSILSVFGKDIEDNILLLVTFADGTKPPVIDAVEKAKIPYTGKMYKFNNSALFAGSMRPNRPNGGKTTNKTGPGKMDTSSWYWNMGNESLTLFFRKLQTLTAQSLVLTKEVLEERKRLEVTVQGLQPQIMAGNCKYESLRKEQQMLEEHEVQIESNKNFKYTLKVLKSRKIDITGEYITNCTKCHFTCHYPCHIANDENKADCAAMEDGVCTVCPGKCAWDVHFNQKYRFEYYEEEEEKTYKEIEARYRDASGKKLTVQQVIQKHLESLKKVRMAVFALIAEAHKSVTRLEQIALKPNPLSTVEYIDLLIEAEKRSGNPGFQARVSCLEDVRKEADLIGKVRQANFNPFEKLEANITIKADKKKGWLKWFIK